MSALHDYIGNTMAGMREGAGDVARSVLPELQDTYYQFLTADATIGPPDGTAGVMQTSTWEEERDYGPPVLETDPMVDIEDYDAWLQEAHRDTPDMTPEIDVER